MIQFYVWLTVALPPLHYPPLSELWQCPGDHTQQPGGEESCNNSDLDVLIHLFLLVDANLDVPDNVISGNEPSSEMLTSQGKNHKHDEPKQVMPNDLDIWYGISNYEWFWG